MKREPTEKFTLRRSIGGWRAVNFDRHGHPLLTRLFGDESSIGDLVTMADGGVKALIQHVIETGRQCDVSVQPCGDIRRSPTFILRDRQSASKAPISQLTINLKWCVFSEHRAAWDDHGFGSVIDQISTLPIGEALVVVSSPSKEARYGKACIRRTGEKSWHVSGVVTEEWDDLEDLADTPGVLLESYLDQPAPDDADARAIVPRQYNEVNRTAFKTIMPKTMLRDLLPMSSEVGGPGVERYFDKALRGDVGRILRFLSNQEDQLLCLSNRLWADAEKLISGARDQS